MPDNPAGVPLALLVLPEAGVDPEPAFRSAPACAPRYYARILAAAGSEGGASAAAPAGAAVIEAPSVAAAVARAVTESGGRAVLVMNAGERLLRVDDVGEDSLSAAVGRAATREYAVRHARLRVTLAGGAVENARWFPQREPRVVARRDGWQPIPAVMLERPAHDLTRVVRALCEAAAAYEALSRGSGAARLLGAPLVEAARVYFAGGWRSGFRGFVFASLHGLFWLIVSTRSWLSTSNTSRSAAR